MSEFDDAIKRVAEAKRERQKQAAWERYMKAEDKAEMFHDEVDVQSGYDLTQLVIDRQLRVGHSEAIIDNTTKPVYSNLDLEGAISIPGVLVQQEPKPEVAMRFVADKMRFDLLPIEALIELTRVYDSGAIKYDDNNWRKGMPWSLVIRPIFSHLFKWLLGQKIDKETGCHHLMMVAWNCITLFIYQLRRLGTDDRASTGFAIDDNFVWEDNHLGLGLSPEQKKELKEKYRKQRENAK